MSTSQRNVLCRYHYDPLDRLADCTPSAQARTQRFYLKERLTSEIQGSVQRSIFQQDDLLLAQQQCQRGVVKTTLLATDQQRTVLDTLGTIQSHAIAYTPYGHRPPENRLLSLLGFNGERPDPVTKHYLLGNGYRSFNPVLMRFNSPDSMSPFGKGGVNAYAYGQGNPINTLDPTGHFRLLNGIMKRLGLKSHKVKIQAQDVELSLAANRPEISLFKDPVTHFKNEKFIGPEHEPKFPEGVQNFPQREADLLEHSDRVIRLEKGIAHELINNPKIRTKTYKKRLLAALKEKLAYLNKLDSYEDDIDRLTNEVLNPPSYASAVDNIKNIRKQT